MCGLALDEFRFHFGAQRQIRTPGAVASGPSPTAGDPPVLYFDNDGGFRLRPNSSLPIMAGQSRLSVRRRMPPRTGAAERRSSAIRDMADSAIPRKLAILARPGPAAVRSCAGSLPFQNRVPPDQCIPEPESGHADCSRPSCIALPGSAGQLTVAPVCGPARCRNGCWRSQGPGRKLSDVTVRREPGSRECRSFPT